MGADREGDDTGGPANRASDSSKISFVDRPVDEVVQEAHEIAEGFRDEIHEWCRGSLDTMRAFDQPFLWGFVPGDLADEMLAALSARRPKQTSLNLDGVHFVGDTLIKRAVPHGIQFGEVIGGTLRIGSGCTIDGSVEIDFARWSSVEIDGRINGSFALGGGGIAKGHLLRFDPRELEEWIEAARRPQA